MTATERKLVREIIRELGLRQAMSQFTYESICDQGFHTYRQNYLKALDEQQFEEAVVLKSYLGVEV